MLDDLTSEAADQTVPFALDGVNYEIDLSDGNAKELRDTLDRYIQAARKTGKVGAPGHRANYTRSNVDASPATIRAWATSQGMTVSPRGRIKSEVLDAFKASVA